MDRVSAVLIACAQLHNFIIKWKGHVPFETKHASIEDKMESLHITPNSNALLGMSFLPVVPDEEFEAFPGISRTKDEGGYR
jgi:hypothetical protein